MESNKSAEVEANTSKNKMIGECFACNGSVSKKARTCPHCGQKKPFKQKSKAGQYILVGLAFWMILSGLAQLFPDSDTASSTNSRRAYSEEESRSLCERGIKASVNNPSTVKIQRFAGYATNIDAAGVRRITQTFSTKNGFGLELTYDAYCTVTPKGELDIKLVEQQ